jgi:hypothetical protein
MFGKIIRKPLKMGRHPPSIKKESLQSLQEPSPHLAGKSEGPQ